MKMKRDENEKREERTERHCVASCYSTREDSPGPDIVRIYRLVALS